MGIIKCYGYDISTGHEFDEYCRNQSGSSDWLIMCFNTDFVYQRNNEMHLGKKYQCLIHSPGTPIIHGPAEGVENGFVNDWMFFSGDEVAELIEKLELPVNESFDVMNSNCLTSFMTQIKEEHKMPMYYTDEYVSGIIHSMLVYVARHRKTADFHDTSAYHSIKKVRRDMLENYGRKFDLARLAETAGYSVSRFCELYKKFYEVSPIDDLINMRMYQAKQYLAFSNLTIGEIAEKCGFDSIHYFSNTFKKYEKCSPSQYRKNEKQYSAALKF